jgi:hypothetical protein
VAKYKRTKPSKRGSTSKPKVIRARRRGEFDGDDDAPTHHKQFWMCEDSTEALTEAWSWADRLKPMHNTEAMMDLIHEAIYRGRPIGTNATQAGQQYLLLRSGALLNLNIIMSMVDTATARLCKKRPMPMISAIDAGWTEKLFATAVSSVLRRKMGSSAIEKENPNVVRDMCIRGDGVWKAEQHGGDVRPKRIPIYELVWDPFEAEQGEPRTLAHVRPEPRDVIAARYPAYRDAIMDAAPYSRNEPWASWAYSQQTTADYIEVREFWHKPSCPGGDDGVHIVAIKGQIISRRKWRWERFPTSRPQWCAPTRGTGRAGGLVEQLAGIQEQINDILKDAREGLKHGSTLTIFVQRGANVNKHHLRKRHPAVIEHDGQEPHYVAPNPVSEQAIRILLMLIEQAYQIAGISQMAAQSKNTLGANASGKAIDTMDDLQSDRFAHVEASIQQSRVELGQRLVDGAQDLYDEAHGNLEHPYDEAPDAIPAKKLAAWIRETEWNKIEIDSGAYSLTLEPVNYLSDSRAGRLAQVAELGQNGLIPDPSIQADLFDEPDIRRANRTILGPKHKLDMVMQYLADPDVPMIELQPDQYTNLALGVLMAKGELNEAESMRNPKKPDAKLEVVLERYREWIELAKDQIKKSKGGDAAPSLPGMMANNMGAAPNAGTLQPGLMGGPAPMAPPPGPGMPPLPLAA